ncbi:LON peptidase substrate-binding domain-containing protein [Nocardioides sp.]|uniref:LON peptidase substrate-binding domain-containing protein n=1 Tax=Nocardioides sp. TaxID=35761 RepID=UPI002C4AAD6F|nr:LON peptidase substrate-binding domain-containing protein [Nocardioides sp.]HXH78074.1 LON peptidase substrate-binding domain-containing protein [Nocardioides sp.]
MTDTLPMFPLNTVLFPGVTLPLHVFEDRYRALVQHLLSIPNPADRVFGSVAIREGYEVGDHGAQSLYRVGVRMQLNEVESNEDGTFEIVATARDRIVLGGLETTGGFANGAVTDSPDEPDEGTAALHDRARATFTAYRAALSEMQGTTFDGHLPRDPGNLSWTLAALAPLPMAERQALLEAESPHARLELVTRFLREELRAINVIPSLPATDVARTAWSPN